MYNADNTLQLTFPIDAMVFEKLIKKRENEHVLFFFIAIELISRNYYAITYIFISSAPKHKKVQLYSLFWLVAFDQGN